MKIALLGYGKMGKAAEKTAIEKGHTIVLKIDNTQKNIDFNEADIAIEFSVPDAAFGNIVNAIKNGIPIVSGTTGWTEKQEEVVRLCKEKKDSFLYTSNFSLGVNLFFELNKNLAKLMKEFDYKVAITETHHTEKKDTPSGTAIRLVEELVPFSGKKNWTLEVDDKSKVFIETKRIKDVLGTHQVHYQSEIDEIEIKHNVKSRIGFAQGAILAAEYIVDKKGVFTMKDVLDI